MRELGIEGAWLYTPRIHHDERGSVLEWFSGREFAEDVGHPLAVAQANCPVTRRGAVRGIHYADVPPGQAKYLTCVSGALLDVIVDVRVGSPTYGRWEAVRLDDRDRQAVYLAEGLGHAFMALSEEATAVYLCSTPYTPEREHGIHPLDPGLGIRWPEDVTPVLSARDAAAPSLAEAERLGLLPSYAACRSYAERLRGGAHPAVR
ncbi:dTDP-4-dehydrorhamnose 3,5-epimerase family protein [Streptomyces sp. NPDC048710]|uniref:dTDP-4-dehydrorhamnose 3,5-epimerase family protein n=1 Tax=unclassified Streptomyces TaxID=2593676 RepID=UPI003717469F